MSTVHGLQCNGCKKQITWVTETGDRRPLKSVMEQVARDVGWQAPDKTGRHWCPDCRLTPKPKGKP